MLKMKHFIVNKQFINLSCVRYKRVTLQQRLRPFLGKILRFSTPKITNGGGIVEKIGERYVRIGGNILNFDFPLVLRFPQQEQPSPSGRPILIQVRGISRQIILPEPLPTVMRGIDFVEFGDGLESMIYLVPLNKSVLAYCLK